METRDIIDAIIGPDGENEARTLGLNSLLESGPMADFAEPTEAEVELGKEKKRAKIPIYENLDPTVLMQEWDGHRHFRIGVVSDLHENSKYTQTTHLHNFYDLAYAAGVRDYYNVGDMDDGEKMRPGHQYECYRQGADEHKDNICRLYPRKPDARTFFITGNHDASLIKHCGYNIGKAIAKDRDDMIYLGPDSAVVQLTPRCKMELRHPWDGTAYAISYKTQKMTDAMSGGEKPNILLIGHYHKAEYIFYRNIHCIQAGTFCAQTPFMKGKSIAAHMGGWILDFTVDEKGQILWFTQTFVPYYKAIHEDYKNWESFVA